MEMAVVGELADLRLQRAALRTRLRRGRGPDPLAGLRLDDDGLDALLVELPGVANDGPELPNEVATGLSTQLSAAEERLGRLLEGDEELARLARFARLSPLEAELLALLAAVEADPRRQRVVAFLNDDVTARHLSMWSLETLFAGDRWDPAELVRAVGPGGGLRQAALLAPAGDAPFAAAPIALARSVMWWLAGDRFLDPDLPAGVEVLSWPPTAPSRPSPRAKAQRDGNGAGVARAASELVVAASRDRVRRLGAAASGLGGGTFLVSPPPADERGWGALVRQATLSGCGVLVEIDGGITLEARDRIERAAHLRWGVTSPTELPLGSLFRKPFAEVSVDPPEATKEEWEAAFPGSVEPAYRLTAQQLHDVRRAATSSSGELAAAVRRLAAGSIDSVAVRIRPSRTWEDLVVEEGRLAQLREIAVRHRRRNVVYGRWGFSPFPSSGVVALFAGPSGTGKTLAAEVVAGELGVDLYKVDLANLVSKYIGETEKNLAQVFEAAEASQVVLFLDEADALLGKRSEVADAHDRYANIEVAYLLQRLESYEGVAVLATNMVNNLDPAFLRRLHVVVELPLPQAAERRRIWERTLPSGAPLGEDLDLDRLAEQVEVSGGTIRNVALRAAFLAAEAGGPITMDILLVSLRRELDKIGRLATATEWQGVFDASGRR